MGYFEVQEIVHILLTRSKTIPKLFKKPEFSRPTNQITFDENIRTKETNKSCLNMSKDLRFRSGTVPNMTLCLYKLHQNLLGFLSKSKTFYKN